MSIVKLIHRALSDSDIRRILGHDTKVIKYSELSHYDDLNQLLPKDTDYCIILYEDHVDHGHWVGLYFDSYGDKADKELEWVNVKMRMKLLGKEPYLSNLLKQEKYIYNTVKYQQTDIGLNTCGAHVVHRLYRLKTQDMDLDAYHTFMLQLKDDFNTSYDIVVDEFVQPFFQKG